MDTSDSIVYAAQYEARKLVPIKDEDDDMLNKKLPYFSITKNQKQCLEVSGFNYEDHVNAPRMSFFIDYMKQHILPCLSKSKVDVTGFYNIELHDSNSYLNNFDEYTNCLVWSRRKNDNYNICLPDVYHIQNYGHQSMVNDQQDYNSKSNKLCFFGSTTGKSVKDNERIKASLWSLNHRDLTDIYITNVVQMSKEDILAANIPLDKILHDHVPPQKMLSYKICLDIPGNTCSWDRIPMILKSNSLLFKFPCNDMCFYYPFLNNKLHYVNVDYNNIISMCQYYLSNPKEASFIIENSKVFQKSFLNGGVAMLYIKTLFEEASFYNK